MPYCHSKDVLAALALFGGEYLADFDGDGTPNTAPLNAAISQADGLIDAYLGSAYALPLIGDHPLLNTLAVDLVIYRLASGDKGTLTNEITKRRDDALKTLSMIRDGKMILLNEKKASTIGVPAPANSSSSQVLLESQPRRFSRDQLEGF